MSGNAISSIDISKKSNPVARLYRVVSVKSVKVCRNRLFDLARQCDDLLSTMREYSPPSTEVGADADENERAVEGILVRVSGWAKLGNTAAFLQQREIRNGIEECRRELAACADRFMVAWFMVKKNESQELEMAQQRDHQRLIDMIADLREEERGRARFMTSEGPWQTHVTEIDGQGAQVAPSTCSRSADYSLSGKVSRVSEDTVVEGTQLVFYIGEWTSDGERVALGRLRDQSSDYHERFKEWIESSLDFQHQHILNFVGHVTIDDVVYSVHSWMENGNIREYIQRNPDADRLRLLSEVASGVEFLHERGIIHGDLCDKNILINRDGKAIVCGFDLVKFSNPAVVRVRWLAPERITTTGVASPSEKADIWSFGLLCLEVFTGEDPFSSYSEIYVPILLFQGTHPEHPGSAGVGLSPRMWDVMQSCWQIDPGKRPSMSEIQSSICDVSPSRDSASISSLKSVDRQNNSDMQAPVSLRRRASELIERRRYRRPQKTPDTSSSGNDNLSRRNSGYSCVSGKTSSQRDDSRASEKGPKTSDNSTEADVISLSSQSSLSSSRSNKRRQFSFDSKRSQTSPAASPSANSDSLPYITLRRGGRSTVPHGAPANTLPNRSLIMPVKAPKTKRVAFQPSRPATSSIILPQNRKRDPVSPVVLDLMEKAATDSEGILQSASDGTVLAGNLEGFVSRVIFGIVDPSKDDRFRATFLTIYQLFATGERLFNILKGRFETTELSPVSAFTRYSILLFIESWLKKGFPDEELKCSSMIKELVLAVLGFETVSETMEAKAREIASLIEDPENIRLRQPEKCTPLRRERAERPGLMTPADLASALTVVEGDRFKCITYWDYVNFARQRSNVRRIEVFNAVHDLITLWVQTTVLQSDLIEQRVKVYEEWIYTAEACRELNNFSSTSAIVTALMSPLVTALALTCKSEANQVLYALAKDLSPVDGVYQDTSEKVATNDLIPWLDLHLSMLNLTFADSSNPILVEVDGHPLIDFKQCSKVAEQIESLVQYSPPPTHDTTRPDVLAYVEYSLKSRSRDDTLRMAQERSSNLAGREQSLLEQQKKMQALGFPWSSRWK